MIIALRRIRLYEFGIKSHLQFRELRESHGIKHKNPSWTTRWRGKGSILSAVCVAHLVFFRFTLFFSVFSDIQLTTGPKGWVEKNSAHVRNLRIEIFKFNRTAYCEPFFFFTSPKMGWLGGWLISNPHHRWSGMLHKPALGRNLMVQLAVCLHVWSFN